VAGALVAKHKPQRLPKLAWLYNGGAPAQNNSGSIVRSVVIIILLILTPILIPRSTSLSPSLPQLFTDFRAIGNSVCDQSTASSIFPPSAIILI
jgi:hypothetical protein